jgi:hypothetical protein
MKYITKIYYQIRNIIVPHARHKMRLFILRFELAFSPKKDKKLEFKIITGLDPEPSR